MNNWIKFVTRLPLILAFLLYTTWELIKSNYQVVIAVLQPGLKIRPGIVAVPLSLTSEAAIFVFANVITLTPGTLTLDVAADKSCLYVHALVLGDKQEFIDSLKNGFEKKISELFK
ncbi:MAG: Na+/H+ antiporter subunit E [Candidatus Omnitrophica bacterium]|jgi:multicomponent Na+:H+ antiporter subunit E|nr:Na+/H+ antiporter subunit E [Candidatus Omnitrophota bacterium]